MTGMTGTTYNQAILEAGMFTNKASYKETYMNYVTNNYVLNERQRDEISRLFDDTFFENKITLYKSDTGLMTEVNPYDFMRDALTRYITVENGAFYLKHSLYRNPLIKTYFLLRERRSSHKVLQHKAEEIGDTTAASFHELEQSNIKLIMNTLYGILINIYSKFYNYDIASSTTIRGRSTVSMNALMIESLMGDYTPYSLEAKLQIINESKSKNSIFTELYRNPSDDELLEHLLKEHKDDYYALDYIQVVIDNLSEDERKKVFYTNNFKEFIKIPKVTNILKSIISKQDINYNNIKDIDSKDYKKHLHLDAMKPPVNIEQEFAELKEMALDILFGMYWYEGDTDEYGNKFNDTQDIIRNIMRKRVALIDTDSNIFLLEEDIKDIKNVVGDITTNMDDKFCDYVMAFIAIYIISILMRQGLDRYCRQSQIPEEYIMSIDYKQEYLFETLQLTKGAKNYLAKIIIKEGTFLAKSKMDLKGLSLKKVNFNPFISKKASEIVMSIGQVKTPDINLILSDIDNKTNEIIEKYRSVENIELFTTSKLKQGEEDANKFDHRYKAIEIYRLLFPELPEIELPGYFLITKLDFENRSDMEDLYPKEFKLLTEYADKKTVALFIKSILNKFDTLEQKVPKELIKEIKGLNKLTENEARTRLKELRVEYNDYKDYLKTPPGISLKDIKKIALPIDAKEVPKFVTEFMSIDEITVFQNLISVVVEGLGLVAVKNNQDNSIVHNIVSYY